MKLFRAAPVLLAAVPPLVLLVLLWLYPVSIPKGDEWDLLPILDRALSGRLEAADIWANMNEHRKVFPKLVWIGLASATHWDHAADRLVGVVFALAALAAAAWALARAAALPRYERLWWLLPLFSAVIFSLRQYENWTWGVQMCMFMAAFGAVAGLAVLSGPSLKARHLAVAAALGIFSLYSFGSGFGFWPAAFAVLAARPVGAGLPKRHALFTWSVISAVTLTAYFIKFTPYERDAAYVYGWQRPLDFILYLPVFLGGFFTWKAVTAAGAGAAGLFFFVFLAGRALRRPGPGVLFLFPLGLGLLTVANGFIAALFRAGLGVEYAAASRYVTSSYPFWLAVFWLAAAEFPALAAPSARRLWAALLIFAALAAVYGSALAANGFRITHTAYSRARTEILSPGGEPGILRYVYFDGAVLSERLETLRRDGLSLYAR